MAGSDSSKDTQEEKPRLNQTDLPSCLNLTVPRKKQWAKNSKGLKSNVSLYCTEVTKDKDPGEEPTCPKYTCISEPTQRNCSAISFIQIYYLIQCSKAGQELQQKELESLKCWAKSTGHPKNVTLCCSPEVLEKVTAVDVEKLWATKIQHLIDMDPQETSLNYQTPKTLWDHQISPGTSGNSPDVATSISFCVETIPGYQHPGLGQESSQGSVIAAGVRGVTGVLGALGFLVVLGYLGLRWWRGRRGQKGRRGRREKRRSSKDALKAEEEEDGDGL